MSNFSHKVASPPQHSLPVVQVSGRHRGWKLRGRHLVAVWMRASLDDFSFLLPEVRPAPVPSELLMDRQIDHTLY